jgi:Zn-dependent protease with chaperone function
MTDLALLTLQGQVFDGFSLAPRRATLSLEGNLARLEAGGRELEFPLAELGVSPRVFTAPRFVTLPNGWEFIGADQPGLERLTARSTSEGPVAWLERRIGVAVAAVLATMAGLALAYFYGLPRLADSIAAHITPERERILGQSALDAFDGTGSASDLDDETVRQVKDGFAALERGLPPGVHAELEFRNARAIGPNAFALPGGTILITDQLIETCSVDEAIVVLAHELGHVEHRHPLKFVLQKFGIGALGMLFGDASSVPISLSALPIVLARSQYSQQFEFEADAEGFTLAKKADYSPELFASCLQKLAKGSGRSGKGKGGSLWSYVSSHPPDAERIARAHAAAAGFVSTHSKPPSE